MKKFWFISFGALALLCEGCQTYRDPRRMAPLGATLHSRAAYQAALADQARIDQIEADVNAKLADLGARCSLTGLICHVYMSDRMLQEMTPLQLQRLGVAMAAFIDEKRGVTNPLWRTHVMFYYGAHPYYETP